MATRRTRNHAAEYAAAKRRAQAAGYSGQHEYRQAKKRLGVKGRVSPVPKKVTERIIDAGLMRDNAAKAWGKRHSKTNESAWSDSFSEPEREAYFNAYVKPSRNRAKWRREHKRFLVGSGYYTEEEYNERYGGGVAASTA